MRKIPVPLVIAAVFLTAVVIYLTFTVNTGAPPVWTTAANTTLTLVSPQTYFIYGTEFNRVVDGKSLDTVSQLGSRATTIAVNNTAKIPWFIVSESRFTGAVTVDPYYDEYTFDLPMMLALAYNESQISSRYGANVTCAMINGTSVTFAVSPKAAPGYIALGYYLVGTLNGKTWGLMAEYVYIGKAVAPNGFTWYLYLAAPLAGAAVGKMTINEVGCRYQLNQLNIPLGTLYKISTSGYLSQITILLNSTSVSAAYQYHTLNSTLAANVTASTTPVAVPAGAASTIYGPDGMVIGIAMPLESYAFPINNGPVKITYNP